MAAITTANINNHDAFIPELWASRVLMSLFQNTAMLGLVNRDWENIIQSQGDQININKPGAVSANDKTYGNTVTLQSPTGTKISIVLSTHKEVSIIIEDVLKAQSQPDVMDMYTQEAGKALAGVIDTALLLAAYTGAQYQVGNASSDMTEADILSARKKLNLAQVPYNDRNYVVRDFEPLLKIDRFTRSDALGFSNIPNGLIGRMHGFNFWEDPRVIEVAGSPNALHNVAFQKDGITLATRPLPMPDPQTGVRSYVMNQNGVGLRVLWGYNMSALGMQLTVDVLYGIKVIRAEEIVDHISKP